jgi:hypothetical protein
MQHSRQQKKFSLAYVQFTSFSELFSAFNNNMINPEIMLEQRKKENDRHLLFNRSVEQNTQQIFMENFVGHQVVNRVIKNNKVS